MKTKNGGKKHPGRNPAGTEAAAARQERLARQLRANLAKRKQQQRKRDAGDADGDGA
ncbi:MAG: hypothetical protein COW30_13510 [Rhodospirillales bacterium CG15_BIG_FIL_POST_REV_8_21_14_020_66_15]|nr:MAG: hypothetical protein COW30_13510 [Rhodospirillales bacterium CG15_BIG_FIL_POST_REV_8_21_14_020_66_15]